MFSHSSVCVSIEESGYVGSPKYTLKTSSKFLDNNERMRWRHLEKLFGQEAVAADITVRDPSGVDKDILELLQIASTFNAPDKEDAFSWYKFEKGLDFD